MALATLDKIDLAAQFVNSTASHIFLTGKAGTGKTTFLHNLAKSTHKRFVVVAPTGIAALNARGVTIHSQFLLPLGSFIPDRNAPPIEGGFYNQQTLLSRHNLNSVRKQVLRDIDLLIIDEVSMLRADVLDAIDSRLRFVKGNYREPFGGVQLLMIGDMHQLPPVVKEHEWGTLRRYYKSPHFFESHALKESNFIYLELDKIFRQHDDQFIDILNNLRNDICTREDLEILNSHYSREEPEEETITITTHNYRADQMNQEALNSLPGASFSYHADIEGNFPENIFPLPERLELKVDAQVMFIKNDTVENRFYNGKLATVTSLDSKEITVQMAGEGGEYTIEKMLWENIKYNVDEETKELKEEVVGTFRHFPVKLAWAITVHKSQGLTFDRANIDVGKAFAPGQVYVALSRLRSLDGLTLHTRINDTVISSDEEVKRFSAKKEQQQPLSELLQKEQERFLQQLINETFDFTLIIRQLTYVHQGKAQKMEFEDEEMQVALDKMTEQFSAEKGNSTKFRSQLNRLLQEKNHVKLLDRLQKGSDYYLEFLFARLKDLLLHLEEVYQFSRTRTYQKALEELDQMVMKKITDVQKSDDITTSILNREEIKPDADLGKQRKERRAKIVKEVEQYVLENPKEASSKSGRKRKKKKGGKKEKGATYRETYSLIEMGISIEKIAEQRGLAVSTIEGHVARGIQGGEVKIGQVMDDDELQKLKAGFAGDINVSLKDVFAEFHGKVPYNRLKIVQAHLQQEGKTVAKDN